MTQVKQTKRQELPPKLVATLVVCFLLAFTVMWILYAVQRSRKSTIRQKTVHSLRRMGPDAVVTVNGRPADTPQRIVEALLKVAPHRAHHSHPLTRFPVVIADGTNQLSLELARDSLVPDEFYLYNTQHPMCEYAAIGSIRTGALADQVDGIAGFSSVHEALSFIIDCLEQDDAKRLTAACVGGKRKPRIYLAENPKVFTLLKTFHETNDFEKSYGNKTFPKEALVYKLGGHGKMFHNLHIDFVKQGENWHLADISKCN